MAEEMGLEMCSWKEAIHVQGVHPKGLAPGQFMGTFNFFNSACILQKCQEYHIWNQEQKLP